MHSSICPHHEHALQKLPPRLHGMPHILDGAAATSPGVPAWCQHSLHKVKRHAIPFSMVHAAVACPGSSDTVITPKSWDAPLLLPSLSRRRGHALSLSSNEALVLAHCMVQMRMLSQSVVTRAILRSCGVFGHAPHPTRLCPRGCHRAFEFDCHTTSDAECMAHALNQRRRQTNV